MNEQYTIDITQNTEDPSVGGYFAAFVWDPGTRGFGHTKLSAVLSLVLVTAESYEEDLSEQAGDIVGSAAIQNIALEKALERRYGGRIDYIPDHKLTR